MSRKTKTNQSNKAFGSKERDKNGVSPNYSKMVDVLRGDREFTGLKLKSAKHEFLKNIYKVEDKGEANILIDLCEDRKKKENYWQELSDINAGEEELRVIRSTLLRLTDKQEQYSTITDYIRGNNHIKSDNRTKDCHIYSEENGRFVDKAEVDIKEIIDTIDPMISNHGKGEILDKIKIRTPSSVYDFNNQNVIACKNRVIDLETYEISSFSPKYNLTRGIKPIWDPNAESEILDQFLKDITNNNQDMIDSLLEIIADCLNPHYYTQKLHIFKGEGANGKGAFCRLVTAFLDKEYVSALNTYQLNSRFMTYRLFGSFANIAGDISAKEINFTGIIKNMRGEDYIEADRKNQKPLKFKNTAKGIFCCQEMPTTEDQSNAWYRSFLIYNFDQEFPISDFEKRLITPQTLSALLNKVLIAHKRLKDNKYHFTWEKHTPTIQDQRLRYDFASNNVKAFYEYACEFQQGNEVPKKVVLKHYKDFCKMFNLEAKKERLFAKHLKKYATNLYTTRPRIDKKQIAHWKNIKLSKLSRLSESNSFYPVYYNNTLPIPPISGNTLTQLTQLTQKTLPVTPDFWKENILQIVKNAGEDGIKREEIREKARKVLRLGVGYYNQLDHQINELLSDYLIIEPKKDILQLTQKNIIPKTPEMELLYDKINDLIELMLDKADDEPVEINKMLDRAVKKGLSKEKVVKYIDELTRRGKYFEPRQGYIKKP